MNASAEKTLSLWVKEMRKGGRRPGESPAAEGPFPKALPLIAAQSCDTVVVGGGIAGLSVAYELTAAGQKVVVVDRGPLGGGMTSRTTAHLAPVCDDLLSKLIGMRGEAQARLFHQSQCAAVDRIEEIVGRHGIDCGFRRLDGYLFPALGTKIDEGTEQIEEELKAGLKLGVEVERVRGVPLEGLSHFPALRYANQATFHPLRYLKALAAAVIEGGGSLYAESAVIGVEEKNGGVTVQMAGGHELSGARAVFATNSPINNLVAIHSKMAPYRTYAMAFELPRGGLPDALYWDMADPYHYVRLHPAPDGKQWLIAGGEDHKSGEADDGSVRFEALEGWIRKLVPALGPAVTRWSGQVLDTIDYCGYIGLNPGSKNVWVVTGDSGQGMTHGALAGMLLRKLILGEKTPWEEVYDPSRKTVAGALNYLKENVTAVESFAEYLTGGEIDSAEHLRPGQGGLLRKSLKKIAAARDEGGVLHLLSASCTHLGCIVHWNQIEQCWDCPCHGSQFAPDGAVLNGPAVTPLAAVDEGEG
jgi:glycine/D-amino acid oxidase-like deaminating enzyme/nitrite reductase/ring-hydroxylating ferredoxin subunit